jgi:hypothetical protein
VPGTAFGNVPASYRATKKFGVQGEGKENLACKKAAALVSEIDASQRVPATTGLQSADEINRLIEVSERIWIMSRSCLTTKDRR